MSLRLILAIFPERLAERIRSAADNAIRTSLVVPGPRVVVLVAITYVWARVVG